MGAIISDDFYEDEPHFYARHVQTEYPAANEELFEYIALLEAIDAATKGQFTMLELGAGYGRWMVNAAKAAQQRDLTCHFVGFEAEPDHFQMMIKHFRNNKVYPWSYHLIEAAVTDYDGTATFAVGSPKVSWSQTIVDGTDKWDTKWTGKKTVRAISLTTILKSLEAVDLIDLDIQGDEFKVLSAARDALSAKVKRVHIGTHEHDIELSLRQLFSSMGWECRYDYPCKRKSVTPFGKIAFQDGVQDWVNTKIGA
jgi:FkbM family methyltransferase